MNRVVREHYPVDKLPDDLQAVLPDHRMVTIVFYPEAEKSERRPISHLVGSGINVHGNEQEVLDYIAQLREDR